MAGQSITLSLPAIGEAGPGYATKILNAITALETELERPVVPADMSINANLSFLSGASNYGAVDLKLAGFSLQSESAITAASFPMTMFVGSSDGELYFNDNAGRQIQITTDGSVNVSTSGGITGSGYGASGVEIRWDSGGNEYEIRGGSGTNDYADLRLNDLYLSDGSTNFIRIAAPSISADYTLTLPAAVPASNNTVVTVNTSGTVSFTGTPTLTSVVTTGSVTVGNGLTVSAGGATITGSFTNSITLASNQHVTVSGTGKFKHGDVSFVVPFSDFVPELPATSACGYVAADGYLFNSSATDTDYVAPLVLPVGAHLSSIVFWATHGAGGGTRQYNLWRVELATGTATRLDQSTSTSSSAGPFSRTLTLNHTIAAGYAYYLNIFFTESGDRIFGAVVTYDQP